MTKGQDRKVGWRGNERWRERERERKETEKKEHPEVVYQATCLLAMCRPMEPALNSPLAELTSAFNVSLRLNLQRGTPASWPRTYCDAT